MAHIRLRVLGCKKKQLSPQIGLLDTIDIKGVIIYTVPGMTHIYHDIYSYIYNIQQCYEVIRSCMEMEEIST